MNDKKMIEITVQHYIDGAISGSGQKMKPAFHADAAVYGYLRGDLFAAPVQALFDWNDQNGPATELKANISNIEIIGTIAMVRLELDNWTGSNFTDLLSLLKVDGEWKVMNKVFHTRS
jgi:hypothetical protein